MAEPIFFDVLPKFGFAAFEAGLTKFKSASADAGKIAGESLTGGTDAALKKLQEGYTSAANTVAKAAGVVSKANADIGISAQKAADAAGIVETRIKQLAEAYDLYGAGTAKVVEAENRLQVAWARSDTAIHAHAVAMNEAMAAQNGATAAADAQVAAHAKMTAAQDGTTASTMAMGRAFNTVGVVSAAAFGAALYETGKAAGDFQQSQMRLVSSAGETAQGMKVVSDGVLQLAGQVGYSAGQLSEGMYTVESAGYRGADGLKVITAAAQGAKAENADLKKVTDGLTTSMTDFGYAPDQAALVMSKLVTAVGESKANFEEFTNSLHSVEPAAAGAHISLDDVYGSLARITQSGTSAEQATQNMADAIRHLQGPTDVQAAAMAKFGISAEDVQQKLSQRGLSGTMQYLSDTIRNQLDPAGNVSVSALNENAQAAQNAADMMTKMSPAAAQTAQAFANGTISRKEYTAAIKGSNSDDAAQLQQFGALELKLDGFTNQYKNGRSLLETYAQALKEVTGDVAGYNVALQLSGPHTEEVNAAIKAVAQTTTDADGKVKGFNETQQTLNAKMADAKAAFGAAAIELGDVFIPTLTDVATGLAHVGTFLAQHKILLEGAMTAVGLFGARWVWLKGIGIAESILAPIVTGLLGVVAGEDAAAAGAVRLAGALSALGPIVAGIGAGKWVGDHIADTNKDHYFNADGTMKGGGDQWIVDNLGPVGKFLEPAGAKTTDEARNAAAASANPYGDASGVQAEVQRRIAASSAPLSVAAAAGAAIPGDPNARPDITAPGSIDPEAEAAKKKAAKSPAGDKNDPIWITGGQDTKGGKDSEVYNPFAQFQTGGFTPASLVGFATTFALNQALGNPYGKQLAAKRGESPTSPLYVSNVDVANAQTAYDKAVQSYGPDSTEATKAQQKLQGTQAAVGTTGGYFDPKTATISAHAGTTDKSQEAVAAAIIAEGQRQGKSRDEIVAGLNVAKLESNYGANPMSRVHQNQSGTDVSGIFQQDPGYTGDHNDPTNAARQFFQRMGQRARPGDSAGQEAVRVQVGTYGGGYVDSQNQGSVYDRLAPTLTAPTTGGRPSTGGGWGASPLGSLSDFTGGGGGQSPVFRRAPAAGIGSGAGGAGSFGSPFAPGGALGATPRGGAPLQFGPPGLPGQAGPGSHVGPFPTPAGVQPMAGMAAAAKPNLGSGGAGVNAPGSVGGRAAQGGTGKGAGIGGGAIGAAESAAAVAANVFAPGSGEAVQMGTQLINRAIGYGGQLAGIGISGLFETFGLNDSPLADPQKSVIGRLAGGFAGAHKTADNVAGQSAPPLKPPDNQAPDGTAASGNGSGKPPGPTTTNHMTGKGAGAGVYVENMNHTGDGPDLASQIGKYQTGPR